MTVSEMMGLLKTLVDDEVGLERALVWFNECSDDIAAVARMRVSATAEFEGGKEFALPSDLVTLVELKLDDTILLPAQFRISTPKSHPYSRWGGVIEFHEEQEEGTLHIYYHRRLQQLEGENDTPEIPFQFHRLYPLFAGARYWKMWGDEPQREHDLRLEYETLKAELNRYTDKEGHPGAFRQKMVW